MKTPFLHVAIASSLLAAVIAGCSCETRTPRRDGGGFPDPIDTGGVIADTPAPDVFFEPVDAPPFDGPCVVTTPVMNEIIGDPPDILLVTDISGSMCTPLLGSPGGMTKLALMKASLTALVTEWDSRVNFGMMLFPGDGACGAGTVTNPIMPRNAVPISDRLATLNSGLFACATMNTGATPTHISIDAARSYFASIPVNPVGRYVILATDGLPNCGPMTPEGETEETVEETITAIEALRTAGVNTYVLGFGDFGGGDTLRRMAEAGGTMRAYNPRTAGELDMALEDIAAEVTPASCTVALDGPVRDPALFQVSFDGGALIPRDPTHSRGWDYDAATNTITFYGAECTTVESGGVADIAIDFGCPGPVF